MEESSPEAVWIRLISKGKNLQNPQKIAFYFDSFFRFKIAAYFEVSPKLLVKSKSHEIAWISMEELTKALVDSQKASDSCWL